MGSRNTYFPKVNEVGCLSLTEEGRKEGSWDVEQQACKLQKPARINISGRRRGKTQRLDMTGGSGQRDVYRAADAQSSVKH